MGHFIAMKENKNLFWKLFCQTLFILQATWLHWRMFLGFIGLEDNGFLNYKTIH